MARNGNFDAVVTFLWSVWSVNRRCIFRLVYCYLNKSQSMNIAPRQTVLSFFLLSNWTAFNNMDVTFFDLYMFSKRNNIRLCEFMPMPCNSYDHRTSVGLLVCLSACAKEFSWPWTPYHLHVKESFFSESVLINFRINRLSMLVGGSFCHPSFLIWG